MKINTDSNSKLVMVDSAIMIVIYSLGQFGFTSTF